MQRQKPISALELKHHCLIARKFTDFNIISMISTAEVIFNVMTVTEDYRLTDRRAGEE
jgi:hypothetical protein